MIDAEAQYEGKYAAADLYIGRLRAAIGAGFPLSLAGFPYVDYHPAFPYSVFLGPGGATVNQPQMYWKDIGTSVHEVFAHTYLYNRLWGRPIFPIGQTYGAPSRFAAAPLPPLLGELRRGAELVGLAGDDAARVGRARRAGRRRGRSPASTPKSNTRCCGSGRKATSSSGPRSASSPPGAEIEVDGIFEGATRRAVRAFQEAHGLPADGQLGSDTWAQLVDYTPARVEWAASASASALDLSAALATRGVGEHADPARRPCRRSATSSAPLRMRAAVRLIRAWDGEPGALAGDLRRQPAEGRRADHQLVAVAEPDPRFAARRRRRPGCRWRRCRRARASSGRRGRRPAAALRR